MSAPGQGTGTAASGDGQGTQQADGGQSEGLDANALASELAQSRATQQETYQWMQDNLRPQEAQQQETKPEATTPEPLDLSWLDPDSPTFDPNAMAQQLSGLVESNAVEQRVQQAVAPVQQQQEQMQREQEIGCSARGVPRARRGGDDGEGPADTSKQYAEAVGHPELADEPWFWRTTYVMGRAIEQAQEEQGDGPAPAHLESGSGAAPAGGGGQGMTAEDIVGARRGASVLPWH
jgi:hypothetical protein